MKNIITGNGHPEQPKRVFAIKDKLKKRKDLIWEKPEKVFLKKYYLMTHSKDYIINLKNSFPQKGLKVFRWRYSCFTW